MNNGNFVIKGDICWSAGPRRLETQPGAFLACVEGKSGGVFARLPEQYAAFPLADYTGRLVVPGLVDLHTHAPQFAFRGLGMDLELLDWLKTHAFPEEAKYRDIAYARRAYGLLVEHLKRGPNTRLVIFATVHTPATLLLMDLLEESGLVSLVGKVNMDRNSPDILREANAAASLAATREWLDACAARNGDGRYTNTRPIITPRFIPSCGDELMRGLGELRRQYGTPIQSHLSENKKEIAWVRELCPESGGYGAAYRDFGLFGGDAPTVMAHCVWSNVREIALMAEQGVFAAHCPQSNTNLSSGIAPVRRFLEAGVPAGLGSDVAGGAHTSIFRAMADAIQVSKLRGVMYGESPDADEKALTLEEAFYLGTAGGGAFFARCGMGASGSFEPGHDFDAVVIDDTDLAAPFPLSIRDRLERVVYLSDGRHITAKYARGMRIMPARAGGSD
ncbi:MAG: amidohydrolase family protein [Treponema sp.]|jgi:guanine deaminase|nr:amidohydrolase family protein [Treponema sp.]